MTAQRRRIWRRVAIGRYDLCWPWLGATNEHGYGSVRFNGASRLAHRVIFQLVRGIDPGEMCVCHHCDNPPCCNPAHLFLGTQQDNVRDMWAKRRASHKGTRHPKAFLTDEIVLEIRRRYANGERGVDLAREFGLTRSHVYGIYKRRLWRHL